MGYTHGPEVFADQQGLLEKSKLPQNAYEKGHRVGWDDARILEIGSNSRYR
jgi:hypothetical protein